MNLPGIAREPKAFTLIELMIVVTIITIVSGASIPAFSKYIRNQNLKQAREQLKSDFRNIQNKALTGALSDQQIGSPPQKMEFWGISFTANSPNYTFFISPTDVNCENISNSLSAAFTIANAVSFSVFKSEGREPEFIPTLIGIPTVEAFLIIFLIFLISLIFPGFILNFAILKSIIRIAIRKSK